MAYLPLPLSAWRAEEFRSFARAIHGHPTITRFEGGKDLPYKSMDALYSALATLPALKHIALGNPEIVQGVETNLANPESLTELLRVPTLQIVNFDQFNFTRALCQATANALIEGTVITKLYFRSCSFSAEESAAVMANAFARNTSVVSIHVHQLLDVTLIDALTAALLLNSTLQHLSLLGGSVSAVRISHMSQVFLALGKNTALKKLKIGVLSEARDEVRDESLCTAIKDGLGMNETLESLELKFVPLCDDNADLWRGALSFLRTNKAIKALVVDIRGGVTESCLSAFRIDIVAMLQENTSLERLTIFSYCKIKAEQYFVLVTALQHNTALKTLSLYNTHDYHSQPPIRLTDDENKQMAALLKKNSALERFPGIDLKNGTGDVHAILRLNIAGRWYLVQDGSSISKGVEVLSSVNDDDINCVFLHLLENPRRCDRRAVEMTTAGERNSISTSPNASSGGGKREQASAHESSQSRRRLA